MHIKTTEISMISRIIVGFSQTEEVKQKILVNMHVNITVSSSVLPDRVAEAIQRCDWSLNQPEIYQKGGNK